MIREVPEVVKPYFRDIYDIIMTNLSEPKSQKIRIEALRSCSSLLPLVDKKIEIELMRDMLPRVLMTISNCLVEGDADASICGFEIFDDFAESHIKIFDSYSEMIMNFMVQVIHQKGLKFAIRSRAAMFLQYLCEFQSKKVLKYGFTEKILNVSIGLFIEKHEQDSENETPDSIGALLLDAICGFFDDSIGYKPALQAATQLITNENEHSRKAGFKILSVMADSRCFEMRQSNILDPLLKFVLAGMQDTSAYVRKNAIETLMEFSFYLTPDINSRHEIILPALFEAICRQSEQIDIFYVALSALEVFIVNMESEILLYLPSLMDKLSVMYASDNLKLKNSALTAVASIAIAAKQEFIPYYNQIIITLRYILTQNVTNAKNKPDLLNLQSNAIRCLGSIAKGVGSIAFQPVFTEFMDLVIANFEMGDPDIKENGFCFFQDMAELYGSEFLKAKNYFEMILIFISASISSEEGFKVSHKGDMGSDSDFSEYDGDSEQEMNDLCKADIVNSKERDYDVNISAPHIHEKSSAITSTGVFAKFIGEPFLPYLEGCCD